MARLTGDGRPACTVESRRTGVSRGGAATDVSLIYVPFMAGDAAHPVSQARARYAQAGAERLLADVGVLAGVGRVDLGPAARRSGPDAAGAVSHVLQHRVRHAVGAGQLPVVLA